MYLRIIYVFLGNFWGAQAKGGALRGVRVLHPCVVSLTRTGNGARWRWAFLLLKGAFGGRFRGVGALLTAPVILVFPGVTAR